MQVGPTAFRPGPILLTQAITVVSAVVKSGASKLTMKEPAAIIIRYRNTKPDTAEMVLSAICFPAILIGMTAVGWSFLLTSRLIILKSMMARMTFMPPPVEEAQPPISISSTRSIFVGRGQRSKSAVA